MVWAVSVIKTIKNCENVGFFDDLKKHILAERKQAPSCGTQKAKNRHHIHTTLSTVGNLTINCFSLPENKHTEI